MSADLLTDGDPPPFKIIPAEPQRPVLLVCDHASATVPHALGRLGLPEEAYSQHIALDVGARAVVDYLQAWLTVPAVICNYSRLVVDCNRRLSDPTAFPESSDGRIIPANQALSAEARQRRADAIYWPYHHAIRDELTSLERLADAPALIAIHSFVPSLAGSARPWHFGILWDLDPRIPVPLMRNLRASPDLLVGDNQPYSGKHPADFTVDHHAEAEGLPYVSIEIRQDLIAERDGAMRWAEILAGALQPVLDNDALYTHWSGD